MPKKKSKRNSNYKPSKKPIIQYTPGPIQKPSDLNPTALSGYSEQDIQIIKDVKKLCLKYPGLTSDQTIDSQILYRRSYQKELEIRGISPTENELASRPRIMLGELAAIDIAMPNDPKKQFKLSIPPFKSGVFDSNKTLLYFNLDEYDPVQNIAKITTSLHTCTHDNSDDYVMEVKGSYTVELQSDTCTVQMTELYENIDLINIIPVNELDWAQIDKDIWSKYIIPATNSTIADARKNSQAFNLAHTVCQLCANHISYLNIILGKVDITQRIPEQTTLSHSLLQTNDMRNGKDVDIRIYAQEDDWDNIYNHTTPTDPFSNLTIIPLPEIYRKGKFQKESRYVDCLTISKYFTRTQAKQIYNLQMKYPGLNSDAIYTLEKCLATQYGTALIESGLVPSPVTIKTADVIDVSDTWLHDKENQTGSEIYGARLYGLCQYIWKTGIYSLIPCFETGVLKAESLYAYFEITNINLDIPAFTVRLYTYNSFDDDLEDMRAYEKSAYSPVMRDKWLDYLANTGAYGQFTGIYEAEITLIPDYDKYKNETDRPMQPFAVKGTYELLPADLYQQIPDSKFKRKPVEQDIWNLVIMAYQKGAQAFRIDGALESKNEAMTNNTPWPESDAQAAQSLIQSFVTEIAEANRAMAMQKTTAKRGGQNTGKTIQVKAEPAVYGPQDKIVRHYGQVKISSRTEPKRVTATTIKHYRMATWSVRGHMRHLKSGKTIYIKPTTAKRKCVNIQGNTTPATLVKIHTNSTESEATT